MSEKWTITFDNDMHGNSWWQIDADDRSVADVYEAKDTVLIAAAPDLLEALELVMPWASKAVADHYNQKAGERALDVAHAAIEKATAIN